MLALADISEIEFDLRARDEIPKLLMGIQAIYCNLDVRKQVFEVLMALVPEGTDPNNGRTGMDLWKILVLGPCVCAVIGIVTNSWRSPTTTPYSARCWTMGSWTATSDMHCSSCNFDKGFHSPANQEQLAAILDEVIP